MSCLHLLNKSDDRYDHWAVKKYDDGFYIEGCCGGCFALQKIQFCPFCGVKL